MGDGRRKTEDRSPVLRHPSLCNHYTTAIHEQPCNPPRALLQSLPFDFACGFAQGRPPQPGFDTATLVNPVDLGHLLYSFGFMLAVVFLGCVISNRLEQTFMDTVWLMV